MTTATYYDLGIRFQFPENWRLHEEEKEDWPKSVTVQSPQGGLWAVHIYPQPMQEDAVAEEVASALQEEYDDVEISPATERYDQFDASGFDMHFYCLDFLVRAGVRAFTAGQRTFAIFFQAEDREFDDIEPVFSALTHSLIRNLS